MDNRKNKQQRSKNVPLKRGQRILLRKGKGPKTKYNGREVSVLEYPSKGSWMTVTLRKHVFKWRKSHCARKSPAASKQEIDRVLRRFNDDVLGIIFAFVVGPSFDMTTDERATDFAERETRETLVWVKDAKKMYSKLIAISAVCTKWRDSCSRYLDRLFGLLDANFDGLRTDEVVEHIHWMISRRVSIGSLTFSMAHYQDIPFLEKLLNTCDTSKLRFVRARIVPVPTYNISSCINNIIPGYEGESWWVNRAYSKRFSSNTIIDLSVKNGYESIALEEKFQALGIPYSRTKSTIRQLHDTIAVNCKNLSELQVNFDRSLELSRTLFSLDSIKKLELGLIFEPGLSFNVNAVLANLVNLEELSLSSGRRYGPRRIRILSERLKSLNIVGLSKHCCICGCMPSLKSLIFGSFTTIIPRFMEQNEPLLSGEASMHEFSLPSGCELIYDGGWRPGLEYLRETLMDALPC